MSVGIELRRARERQGISLDELSRSTKIAPALLEALENEEIERLPAAFYTRAFLRTYALEVGLDPDDTVTDYLSQFEPEPTMEEAEQAVVEASERRDAASRPGLHLELPTVSPRVLIGAAGALVIAAYFAYPRQQSSAGQEVSAQEPSVVAEASLEPAPAAVTHASLPAPTEVLRLDINPGGPCWVQATTPDGTPVFARLLQPGDRQTLEIHDELVLRVGDPAAFGYSIDGVSGRSLGTAGVPVTVRISKQNYRDFLSS